MSDNFKKAVKGKYRFGGGRGNYTVEDLYDLSLSDLNEIAKQVSKELKDSGEENFIPTALSSASTRRMNLLNTKLDVVKEVIADKVEAQEKAKARSTKQARIAQLEALAANKADEALSAKSLEDISKMIVELKAEDGSE